MTGTVGTNVAAPGRRRWIDLAAAGLASTALSGCGSSGSPPTTYVLGAPPTAAAASARQEVGRRILDVAAVRMPDYLDTSDLLVRRGANELVPSRTGRWGERLSAGVIPIRGETDTLRR